MTYIIRYENELGLNLNLSDSEQFSVLKFEGIGGVDASIQTQKSPYQDGSTYIGTQMSERAISLELHLKADDYGELTNLRRKVSRAFNPKTQGILRITLAGKEYEIEVRPEHSPTFPSGSSNNSKRHQLVVIDLLALNPYWRTPTIEEAPTFEPLFSFPFSRTFQMGMQRDVRVIDNDGDSPMPFVVEFHGPAVNPSITNVTTGEFIKVNQDLKEGEVMRIDTSPGKKSVAFILEDGTVRNVFNWIDLDSTLFQLQLGENEIRYDADNDIQGAIVNITYNKLYIGV